MVELPKNWTRVGALAQRHYGPNSKDYTVDGISNELGEAFLEELRIFEVAGQLESDGSLGLPWPSAKGVYVRLRTTS